MLVIIIIILITIALALVTLLFIKSEEKYDENSIYNHLTELENKFHILERKIENISTTDEYVDNDINNVPILVRKSNIGRDSVFYLPVEHNKPQNFLCKVELPSHKNDLYEEIGIIGQHSNGSVMSGFANDYNIIYSFYENLDHINKNERMKTWENMVVPNEWNGLSKPFVFIRERQKERKSPEWNDGWLQVIVFPVENNKRI